MFFVSLLLCSFVFFVCLILCFLSLAASIFLMVALSIERFQVCYFALVLLCVSVCVALVFLCVFFFVLTFLCVFCLYFLYAPPDCYSLHLEILGLCFIYVLHVFCVVLHLVFMCSFAFVFLCSFAFVFMCSFAFVFMHFFIKTSQELRTLSRSLSDYKSLLLNAMIQVLQFVSYSQPCH